MKFESVIGFVYQTAKGMEYVHKNKIIHYDIKWVEYSLYFTKKIKP